MKQRLEWTGQRVGEPFVFTANVPGNIQKDYAEAKNWGDLHYGMNVLKYQEIEDDAWLYTAQYHHTPTDEHIWFVSGGIDYEYQISVNGTVVYTGEGTYAPVEADITSALVPGNNAITVWIAPHPKRPGAPVGRTEADAVAKAPIGYSWDWHPRLLTSGIWNDAWLESRPIIQPKVSSPTYTLSEDFRKAYVHFDIENADTFEITLTAPDGTCTFHGTEADFVLEDPVLWWCSGQGEPNLYTWKVQCGTYTKEGRTGFRRVQLVMNEGTWREPKDFPKSRSHPPITIQLNGRTIFAKGSNFVSPEVFPGVSDYETYEPLVRLAKEANMNIFRCWGGSGVQKETFFELCDEMGIMIWQEFPLACNEYKGTPHYLQVLEKEARAIIRRLRSHPCVVLWCGGNELFNSWSKMTDQSLPLRMLNKICYEEDQNTPYINTSPLSGMAHGGYTFLSFGENGKLIDIYTEYNNAHHTAYTEFGVPSLAPPEYLRTFIPEEELFPPKPGGTYELHHAFNAWVGQTWLCPDILAFYFGEIPSLEDLCENPLFCSVPVIRRFSKKPAARNRIAPWLSIGAIMNLGRRQPTTRC
ncbi:MAG: hypothetical protein IJF56_01885 [Clostridia bacterium]|nr:hypothetical protein [Clostridia bacterium]